MSHDSLPRGRKNRQRLPLTNSRGVPHLHISGDMPEAQELKSHVEGMTGQNTAADQAVFNPAVSAKQRKLMAIAEHNPSAVHAKNRGVLKMSKGQLHDYAATKGL